MNHIFKTVLNKTTGLICVVAENTKSAHKGRSVKKNGGREGAKILSRSSKVKFKKTMLSSLTSLFLVSLISTSSFAQQIYNGSDSIKLENPLSVTGNLDILFGHSILKGIIAKDNISPTESNTDLVVDYMTGEIPSFIVSGYAGLSGVTEKNGITNNNKITIKQGDIAGNLYAGLVHNTKKIDSLQCHDSSCNNDKFMMSNKNNITLKDISELNINGDINSGYAENHLIFTNTERTNDAGDNAINASSGFRVNNSNSTIDTSSNEISILGKSNFNGVRSGYSGVRINSGNITNSDAISTLGDDHISAEASKVDAFTHITGSHSELISNLNTIKIVGMSQAKAIESGHSSITINIGDIVNNNSEAYNSGSYSSPVHIEERKSSSNSGAQIDLSNSNLETSENIITVSGENSFENLVTGYTGVGIYLSDIRNLNSSSNASGDIYSESNASTYADINAQKMAIISNKNSVNVIGDNTIRDISSGYVEVISFLNEIESQEVFSSAISSNGDWQIELNNKSNSSTGINFNFSNSEAMSSNNNVHVVGGNTLENVKVGYIENNFKSKLIDSHNVSSSTDVSEKSDNISGVYLNLDFSKLSSIANGNQVDIVGENIFNDIFSGFSIVDISSDRIVNSESNIQHKPSEYSSDYNQTYAIFNSEGIDFSSNGNAIKLDGESQGEKLSVGVNVIELGFKGIESSEIGVYSDSTIIYRDYNKSVHSNSNADVFANISISNSKLIANENILSVIGENVLTDAVVGHSKVNISIGNITNEEVRAQASVYDGENTESLSSATASASAYSQISSSDFEIQTNENTAFISNRNHIENLIVGSSSLVFSVGDILNNAHAAVEMDEDQDINLEVNADAKNIINLSNSKIISNDNEVKILGENYLSNVMVGYSELIVRTGNILSGTTSVNNDPEKIADSILNVDASNLQLLSNKNKIDILGNSTINGDLYTGYINFNIDYGMVQRADGSNGDIVVNLEGSQAFSTENIMNIDGRNIINNIDSSIYGGYLSYNKELGYKPETYDVFTGNTLNFANQIPISIKEIGNFQTYNFTLDPEQDKEIAMITAEKISLGTNSDNFSDTSQQLPSDFFVTGIRSGRALLTGTEFLLMQGNIEGNGSGHETDGLEQKNVQQGISLFYDVKTKVDADTGKVTATIISDYNQPDPKVNPQLKSLLEGNLASLMLLTRGADNLAYSTFSAITEQNRQKGLVPFVQSSGHHARYNSGSHIDANGGLITAGISFQNDRLTLAVFSENGWDSYDSHNTFVDVAKVDASGNNRFNGGGVFGQYNFNNGLYTDVSFRAGRLHSNYKTEDIRNVVTGETASYKIDSKYFGAHAGIGYQFKINPLNSYDLNLKYLWANTEAQDLMIAGDEIHFDQLNSHRLRLNGENSYQFNPSWSLLFGTGLEYEFKGEAGGTTYQRFRMEAPSVKGFTALGSVGVRFQPVLNKNLTIDFKGQGYLGERDGGGATLHMQYAF